MQTCKLDNLDLNCKQNCLKSQKCNFDIKKDIKKDLEVKVYLNRNLPSLQVALRHCFLKCKNNNNGNKTRSKLKLSEVKSCYYDFVLTW